MEKSGFFNSSGCDAIIGQVLYFTKQAALTLHRS